MFVGVRLLPSACSCVQTGDHFQFTEVRTEWCGAVIFYFLRESVSHRGWLHRRFHASSHQSLHYHYQVRRVVVRQFTMCKPTPSEGEEGRRFNLNKCFAVSSGGTQIYNLIGYSIVDYELFWRNYLLGSIQVIQ